MTKLWVFSDLHIDSDRIDMPPSIPHPEADLIIVAGDIADRIELTTQWLLDNLSTDERAKTIFVPGNHEAYGIGLDRVENAMDRLAGETGITTLLNEVVERAGHRIVGTTLWSELDPNLDPEIAAGRGDGRFIPGLTGDDWRQEHRWARSFLEATIQPGDIVVTHHAPSFEGLHERMQHAMTHIVFASAYFTDLEPLVERARPALWIHGHTHQSRDYQVGETRVLSNQRGRGLPRFFDPDLVIEIDEPKLRHLTGN